MIAPIRRIRTATTETPLPPAPARLIWPALGFAMALGWMLLFAAEARAADAAPVFARVADVVITQKQYDEAYAMAARNKFYHGKPPEAEVQTVLVLSSALPQAENATNPFMMKRPSAPRGGGGSRGAH